MRRIRADGLSLALFDLFAAAPGLVHAVSTREGGISPVPYDTLNLSLSTGDVPEHVAVNRARLAAAIGARPEQVVSCHQVHSARVVRVEQQSPEELRRERADVLVTNRAGRFLSLRFADCVPLLLFDPVRGTLALAHAGWRGVLAGVAAAAVKALVDEFGTAPGDLLAGVGPSIGPCCYQVGEDTAALFADRPRGIVRYEAGSIVLDLWALNVDALVSAGVPPRQIEISAICTRCHADEFFSHRAANGGPSGRFAALAGLV